MPFQIRVCNLSRVTRVSWVSLLTQLTFSDLSLTRVQLKVTLRSLIFSKFNQGLAEMINLKQFVGTQEVNLWYTQHFWTNSNESHGLKGHVNWSMQETCLITAYSGSGVKRYFSYDDLSSCVPLGCYSININWFHFNLAHFGALIKNNHKSNLTQFDSSQLESDSILTRVKKSDSSRAKCKP